MFRLTTFSIACVALLLSLPASAGEARPVVAVFDMEDRGAGLAKDTLENLTQLLNVKLAECGYQVVPREQIRQRLREQKRESYKACYDESCQIELGRELAAQKSLATQILKIGDSCQLGATLFDLKKAAAESAASASGGCGEKDLLGLVEQVAEKLCTPLRERLEKLSHNARSSYEKVLKDAASIKETSARRQSVWKEVKAIASDENIPAETRAELIGKFMKEFPEKSPQLEEATKMLHSIVPGKVKVVSEPAGAEIWLGKKLLGQAPAEIELPEGKHTLEAKLAGYASGRQQIKVFSGKTTEARIVLERIYPMNPYKKWGHICFWSGTAVAATGAGLWYLAYRYALDNKQGDAGAADKAVLWRNVAFGFWGIGGAAMVTGTILWILSPGDREWFEKRANLSAIPLPSGGALVWSGRW